MKLAERITERKITMTVREGAPDNPDFADSDGWTCRIKCGGHTLTVPFYMGQGHHGAEPTLPDVLDCLLSDASGYENARDFSDFAAEYGYSDDSRKAERIYKACGRIADKLRRLLGADFEAFLNDTERE